MSMVHSIYFMLQFPNDSRFLSVKIKSEDKDGTAQLVTIHLCRHCLPENSIYLFPVWALPEKTCLLRLANNTGAYQPAHPRSLISAFVIHLLEGIISRFATSEISIF